MDVGAVHWLRAANARSSAKYSGTMDGGVLETTSTTSPARYTHRRQPHVEACRRTSRRHLHVRGPWIIRRLKGLPVYSSVPLNVSIKTAPMLAARSRCCRHHREDDGTRELPARRRCRLHCDENEGVGAAGVQLSTFFSDTWLNDADVPELAKTQPDVVAVSAQLTRRCTCGPSIKLNPRQHTRQGIPIQLQHGIPMCVCLCHAYATWSTRPRPQRPWCRLATLTAGGN